MNNLCVYTSQGIDGKGGDIDRSTEIFSYGSPDKNSEIKALGSTLEIVPILNVVKYDNSLLESEDYPSVYCVDILDISFTNR